MKKIIFAVTISLVVVMLFTFTGCSGETSRQSQTVPWVDYVKARTYDGNGVVVMVLRTWDNALSKEEIKEIENSLSKEQLTGNVDEITVVPTTEETRVIAFCCSSYNGEAPRPFSVVARASDKNYENGYALAEKWFLQELAGVNH